MSARPLELRLAETTRFRELLHVDACESTQDLAQTVTGDVVVWADEQHAGRGRLGRSWHGAPGRDVEVTFRVEKLPIDDSSVLAAAVPTAIADALEPLARRELRFDWPNDVLCDGRKLSGVLIDASGNPPSTFLIGVGINVNRTSFPSELLDSATSLALLTGEALDREELVFEVARAIDRALAAVARDDTADLSASFRARLGLVGRRVTLVEAGHTLTGTLTDIDLRRAELDGERLVRLALVRELDPA